MRNALRQRESDLQYQEVAKHFARLDIHPGYLAELVREPIRPSCGIVTKDHVAHPVRMHVSAAMDYLSFGIALIGLIVALSTAVIYYGRTVFISQRPVTAQSPIPDPNIHRLDESVRRLSIALGTVISRLEKTRTAEQDYGKIVRVTATKANLRIAPSNHSSAVMAVSQGTNLLVDSEEIGWFKVFAPNGQTLWISKELVE